MLNGWPRHDYHELRCSPVGGAGWRRAAKSGRQLAALGVGSRDDTFVAPKPPILLNSKKIAIRESEKTHISHAHPVLQSPLQLCGWRRIFLNDIKGAESADQPPEFRAMVLFCIKKYTKIKVHYSNFV